MFPPQQPPTHHAISPSPPPSPSASTLSIFTTSSTDSHLSHSATSLPMIPPTPPTLLPPAALSFSPSPSTRLGEGASGAVHRGTLHASPVAVKTCASTPLAEAQFSREVRRLHALRHPNIINVYGVAAVVDPPTRPAHLALVTELCTGASLHHALVSASHYYSPPRLPTVALHRIAAHVTSAITFLHSQNLTHGDLKPLNVLLTHTLVEPSSSSPAAASSFPDSASAKLCDFGLSRRVIPRRAATASPVMAASASTNPHPAPSPTTSPENGGDGCPSRSHSATQESLQGSTTVSDMPSPTAPTRSLPRRPSSYSPKGGDPSPDAPGTYVYLAPECFGTTAAAPSADIFALGMLLYQMLTLRSPWPGKSAWAIFGHVVRNQDRPPWPVEGVPTEWRNLVQSCWAQNPADRPSARQVSLALSSLRAANLVDDRQKLVWADPSDAPPTASAPSDTSAPAESEGAVSFLGASFSGSDVDAPASLGEQRLWDEFDDIAENNGSRSAAYSGRQCTRSVCATDVEEDDRASNDTDDRDCGSHYYDSPLNSDISDVDSSLSASGSVSSGDDGAASMDTVDSLLDGLGIRHVMSLRLDPLDSRDLVDLAEELENEEGKRTFADASHRQRRRPRSSSIPGGEGSTPEGVHGAFVSGAEDFSIEEEKEEDATYLTEPHAALWQPQPKGTTEIEGSTDSKHNVTRRWGSGLRKRHALNHTGMGLDVEAQQLNARAALLQAQPPKRPANTGKRASLRAKHSRTVSLPPDMQSQLDASATNRSRGLEATDSHRASCSAASALSVDGSLHVDDDALAELVGMDIGEPFSLSLSEQMSTQDVVGPSRASTVPTGLGAPPPAWRQEVRVEDERVRTSDRSVKRCNHVVPAHSLTEQEILEELEYLSENVAS